MLQDYWNRKCDGAFLAGCPHPFRVLSEACCCCQPYKSARMLQRSMMQCAMLNDVPNNHILQCRPF